jgi:cytochrome c oxidase assembly protein subunit 15
MVGRLTGLAAFLGLQGVIGWWMVKSGLTAKPDYQSRQRVSTYRLFIHLNAAIIIYSTL